VVEGILSALGCPKVDLDVLKGSDRLLRRTGGCGLGFTRSPRNASFTAIESAKLENRFEIGFSKV
jgi:hypothetical protein